MGYFRELLVSEDEDDQDDLYDDAYDEHDSEGGMPLETSLVTEYDPAQDLARKSSQQSEKMEHTLGYASSLSF